GPVEHGDGAPVVACGPYVPGAGQRLALGVRGHELDVLSRDRHQGLDVDLGAPGTVDEGSGAHDAHAVLLEDEPDDLELPGHAGEGVLKAIGAVLERAAHEEL